MLWKLCLPCFKVAFVLSRNIVFRINCSSVSWHQTVVSRKYEHDLPHVPQIYNTPTNLGVPEADSTKTTLLNGRKWYQSFSKFRIIDIDMQFSSFMTAGWLLVLAIRLCHHRISSKDGNYRNVFLKGLSNGIPKNPNRAKSHVAPAYK